MTRELYAPLKPYFMEVAAKDGYDLEAYERMLDCRGEVMQATLDHLRKHYGGAEDYLRMIGLTESQLERLKLWFWALSVRIKDLERGLTTL